MKQNEKKWEDKYEEIKEHKQKHGACLEPISFIENPQLGAWVSKQRNPFQKEL